MMSVGLFLPLPESLAVEFPSLGDRDTSPPHATLMYFGDTPEDEDRFLSVIRSHLRRWPERITATFRGLRHFDSPHQTVVYNGVRFDADVAGLRSSLISYLSDNGFPATDMSPVYYFPHVTLAYMPPNTVGEYDGPVPEGSWTFDEVEVWGLGDDPVVIPLGGVSSERVAAKLYHVTGWRDLATSDPGDSFTLKPGRQNAEGVGVYFSEGSPVKVTTAEGTAQTGAAAVVETESAGTAGWWRTKPSIARKFNRPITWHTDGKSLSCTVREVSSVAVPGAGSLPLLKSDCSFSPSRVAARYKSKKKIETKDGGEATVYEYSDRQVANRHREKAERVEHLRNHITDLRARVKDDLTSDDPMTRLTALAVSLMDHTCERVGNDDSADDGHYGVTGWLKKHVTFGKGKATIKYVGKSGVKHEKTVDHGPTVTALKELCEGRGAEDAIFDTDDAKISADEVNDYLAEFDVTAKDIRGFRANDEMCKALRAERAKGPKDLPRARKEKDKILKAEFKAALERVAETVGHEAATLRSQYLVPGLEDQYVHDGTVLKSLKTATKSDSQREDEATEKLVKPSPKAKPPRHDLRNERVEVEGDPDLDTTDDDMSLNFKKVATRSLIAMLAERVAARYLDAKRDRPSRKERKKEKMKQREDEEDEFLKDIEGVEFAHPETGNRVRFKSLPSEEQKKVRAKWRAKREKPEEAPAADESEKPTSEAKKPEGGAEAPEPELDGEGKRLTEEYADKDEAEKEVAEEEAEKAKAYKAPPSDEILREVTKDLTTKAKMSSDSEEETHRLIEDTVGKQNEAAVEDFKKQTREQAQAILDRVSAAGADKSKALAIPDGVFPKDAKLGKTYNAEKVAKHIAKTRDARDKLHEKAGAAQEELAAATNSVATATDDATKTEAEGKVKEAKGKVKEAEEALAAKNTELNRQTAYAVGMAHYTATQTDPTVGSSDPATRRTESAKKYEDLTPEAREEGLNRADAEVKRVKDEMAHAEGKEKKALQNELDVAEAEHEAARFSNIVNGEEDRDDDIGTKLIRKFGKNLGIDDPHIKTLLKVGTGGPKGRKAFYNLASKLSDDDLVELVGDMGGPSAQLLKDMGGRGGKSARTAILKMTALNLSGGRASEEELDSLAESVGDVFTSVGEAVKGKGARARAKVVEKLEGMASWIKSNTEGSPGSARDRLVSTITDQLRNLRLNFVIPTPSPARVASRFLAYPTRSR